ncbi:MAG TPA: hypothetical protein VFA57_05350 [Pseudolabrys sp.]|nr:hypothetical protein [Pseudolabrys sp.]
MKTRLLITAALVAGVAAPALADEYYVIRDPHTHHCTVTTTKPTTETTITQIGPLAFQTREKAEDRIKTTKICSEDTTGTKVEINKD